MMTIEEAKEMEGTEFTYYTTDGDSVPCYVKKFDPEIGLTCLTLTTKTKRGHKPENPSEKDGTWCVIGINLKKCPEDIKVALNDLYIIKTTGMYDLSKTQNYPGMSIGVPICAFS